MIGEILALGRKMYDTKNWRECHRLLTYWGRCICHAGGMGELYRFFQQTEARREILGRNPFLLEQVTRAFFYAGSTFATRKKLIEEHIRLMEERFRSEEFVRFCVYDAHHTIWEPQEAWKDWHAEITFGPGQRKEGLSSVVLYLDGRELYQIMFWLGRDRQGETALYIGAMQGPNTENAKELVKETTKRSHRYRTKNLILYMVQAVARAIGVQHIYAVSNRGYYANNHVRRDRKLKTDFGAFWEEAGGHMTEDDCFYELPLVEPRKTMEEVPTRKRAVYRRRFEFQDDVDAQIAVHMKRVLR